MGDKNLLVLFNTSGITINTFKPALNVSLLRANQNAANTIKCDRAKIIGTFIIQNRMNAYTYLYLLSLVSGFSANSSGNTHLSEKAQPTGKVSPTTAY